MSIRQKVEVINPGEAHFIDLRGVSDGEFFVRDNLLYRRLYRRSRSTDGTIAKCMDMCDGQVIPISLDETVILASSVTITYSKEQMQE